MLEGSIIRQKRLVPRPLLRQQPALIFGKHAVQNRLFLLDLLYQGYHRIIIGGDNMAQRHFMYILGGQADLRQPAFAVHEIINNIGGARIYLADIDHGKNVG